MISPSAVLVLGASVLTGSAIPFVPTGEMVSGAAALVTSSVASAVAIFLVVWIGSLLGDTVLLLEVYLVRGRLQRWLDRRRFGARVRAAQDRLTARAFGAVLTGRLVPGGRAPVIMALGLSRFPLRRFLAFDAAACAVWAALYTAIGTLGGSLTSQPVWGMVIAILVAVGLAALVQRVGPQLRRLRRPHIAAV